VLGAAPLDPAGVARVARERVRVVLAPEVASRVLAARAVVDRVGDHSGLPLNLTRHGPAQTGFATVQKTVTALAAEMRHLAQPGSLDFTPVSAGIEDHASNAPFTVAKTADAVERLSYVGAVEVLVAAQALELRARQPGPPFTLGRGSRDALTAVRRVVPALDDDRPPGPDIERIRDLLRSGVVA
jgi:histidine ammonia-lyase